MATSNGNSGTATIEDEFDLISNRPKQASPINADLNGELSCSVFAPCTDLSVQALGLCPLFIYHAAVVSHLISRALALSLLSDRLLSLLSQIISCSPGGCNLLVVWRALLNKYTCNSDL